STLDLCNGADDDCDPTSADGSEDPGVGVACDGADPDLCANGVTVCTARSVVCNEIAGAGLDLCNGADDDCDPTSADGSEDPGVGVACDGADSDLCAEGVTKCTGGSIVCSDTTGSTIDLCNGLDDDCDSTSADGSEDPGVGVACDGADSDLCAEGVTVCTAGSITCNDTTGNTVDLCNGLDDDCDPASADGSEDLGVGVACDGADSDLCKEGTTSCAAGAIACSDTTGSTLDLCNGLDDDCDPASADGSEDPAVGVACDGADSDLCNEGVTACAAGAIACGDTTGNSVESCNGLDDDCNGSTDENGAALCADGNTCTTDACSSGGCVHIDNGSCDVSGTVYYYRSATGAGAEPSSKPVPGVGIDGTSDAIADDTTSPLGTYALGDLSGNVALTTLAKFGSPRASDANGAISAADAAQIADGAVGLVSLSPNQRIAGDVTGDGTISALDASQVARFAALLVDHFDVATATGSDWKFLRCDAYAFPGDPGCGAPVYNFTPISPPVTGRDFYAVLYGDVTGDWESTAPASPLRNSPGKGTERPSGDPRAADVEVIRGLSSPPAVISIDRLTTPLRPGERKQLTIRVGHAQGILGLDLILQYDMLRMAIVDVQSAGLASGWSVAHSDLNGTHRIAAYGILPLAGNGAVLTVTVEGAAAAGWARPLELRAVANEGRIPLRVPIFTARRRPAR
ncbi:MAG TPA: dockerin type I repeat-containing protein, partial [Candidatus Polarisedimenticolaceae bacterium]|nr:dockerin type I repeat-containing protein [Candidatus Polarisedimenticolaceae bacterium]